MTVLPPRQTYWPVLSQNDTNRRHASGQAAPWAIPSGVRQNASHLADCRMQHERSTDAARALLGGAATATAACCVRNTPVLLQVASAWLQSGMQPPRLGLLAQNASHDFMTVLHVRVSLNRLWANAPGATSRRQMTTTVRIIDSPPRNQIETAKNPSRTIVARFRL